MKAKQKIRHVWNIQNFSVNPFDHVVGKTFYNCITTVSKTFDLQKRCLIRDYNFAELCKFQKGKVTGDLFDNFLFARSKQIWKDN